MAQTPPTNAARASFQAQLAELPDATPRPSDRYADLEAAFAAALEEARGEKLITIDGLTRIVFVHVDRCAQSGDVHEGRERWETGLRRLRRSAFPVPPAMAKLERLARGAW